MSIRDKDGWSLDNPSLNVPFLLLVDDNQVVGIQFEGISHKHTVHLQPVYKHLLRSVKIDN